MPEKELRLLWHHQRFDPALLRTTDGRSVVVRTPGIENVDGGPDFHGACVRIGDTTYAGDVEVHLRTGQWVTHGHQNDPHYNAVVLHVVLNDDGIPSRTAAGRLIPVLPVGHCLPEPSPVTAASPPRERLPASALLIRARRLGIERLESRMVRADIRLREIAGVTRTEHEAWDQLLYEGVMEAMGFAKNRMPFLFLARGVHLALLRRTGLERRQDIEAVLFGAGGLLPPLRTVRDSESRAYVRRLQRRWAELRPGLRIPHLLPADWLFFRLRPANFPPVRMAGVAALLPTLFGCGGLQSLLDVALDESTSPAAWWRAVRALFSLPPDRFWSGHVRFGSPAGRRRRWIGRERLLDIAANLLIPCALLLCRDRGGGPEGLRRCMALLVSLPPASCRTLLRSLEPLCTGDLRPGNLLEHQGLIELALRT